MSLSPRAEPPADRPTPEPPAARIARLEADLVAAQRRVLLGTLSGMVAHEINNLMTPILGRADLALSTGQPADMQRALERTRIQVQRAVRITERLLNLAKPQPQPTDECVVADAVRETLETLARPFEKDGIELRVEVPEGLRVRHQADLLEHVLLNLLLNARQAMQGLRGGLKISARPAGQRVIIDVRDSGQGIPPARLAEVINPFLAGADDYGPQAGDSVGLGLSVCRIIARLHGATLEALANEGRGCTFRLDWPADA